jgi:hypothetical protein
MESGGEGTSRVAGLIVVCEREGHRLRSSAADLRRCAARIVPDNIEAHPPLLWEKNGVVAAAVNPGPGTLFREGAVAVGQLYEAGERWWEPGPSVPDGSYALCRVSDRRVELVTDLYASRTLWYVLTDDLFLASSSQRALVALLDSFELNHEAVSWMLSAGYLPPGAGWDARLRRVPPACRLTLDRRTWTLEQARHVVPIIPAGGTEKEHVERLRGAILDACARLDLPWATWLLALSGGMDSRTMLVGLVRAGRRPTCVTWGREAARGDPKNDAAIGERVANHFGLPHVFCSTDFTGEPLDLVLGRFLAVSEGRLDHFDGYTDGLRMWKLLFESGVEGVVRGDEPTQGYQWHYSTEEVSRLRALAHMVADYPPTHLIHRLGLAQQTWPEDLRKRAGESRSAYSGRLFQELYSPAMMSPLNDLKGLYLEVANPLLWRAVVVASHTMPESLRRGRRAMKAVQASMKIGIPFAERHAPVDRSIWLAHPGFREELRRGLSLPAAEYLYSEEAVAMIENSLDEGSTPSLWTRVRPKVQKAVSKRVSSRLKPPPRLTGTRCSLAFRAYIAVRMVELLTEDAALLQPRLAIDDRRPAAPTPGS